VRLTGSGTVCAMARKALERNRIGVAPTSADTSSLIEVVADGTPQSPLYTIKAPAPTDSSAPTDTTVPDTSPDSGQKPATTSPAPVDTDSTVTVHSIADLLEALQNLL